EASWAGCNGADIGSAAATFEAEDPLPNLVVEADVAAPEETGGVHVGLVEAVEGPARRSPTSPEMPSYEETGPLIRSVRTLVDRCLGDDGLRPLRDKLVARATAQAPTLDMISGPIVPTQITDPA